MINRSFAAVVGAVGYSALRARPDDARDCAQQATR
jgi:hypothetical protein